MKHLTTFQKVQVCLAIAFVVLVACSISGCTSYDVYIGNVSVDASNDIKVQTEDVKLNGEVGK